MAGMRVMQVLASLATVGSAVSPRGYSSSVDFIIVGAGPSGLVLAEQLSRNASLNIVVLEAGPNAANSSEINTPAYGPIASADGNFIWNYTSQPDPNLGGVAPSLAQGRVIGGGTGVNYMAYCRGAPSVFDEWANISGIPDLAWSSIYNDFKQTVHFQPEPLSYDAHIDPTAYGSGPIEITAVQDTFNFDVGFIQALSSTLQIPVTDLNNGTGLGVSAGPASIKASNRTRSYALEGYAWQFANRKNVQLVTGAWVQKINFSGTRATGVTYTDANKKTQYLTAREVIVSGGAINTPKLLMLSGVGPADHLKSLSIPVVANISAIGSNLIDHHYGVMSYTVTPNVETVWQWSENQTYIPIAQAEYAKNGSGPLGATNGAPFAVYRAPDSVFAGTNDTYHTSLPADQGQLLFQYVNGPILANSPNVSLISPFVALVRPQAAGYLRLNSSDYRSNPLIYSNYFGSAGDKAAILYGYKKLRQVMASQYTSSAIIKEIFPGAGVTSDADLWKAIQQSATSFHHPLGTVALGTVLDTSFRIKGLSGIRVVDSSAFPTAPTCHIQSDAYAFAHAAARVIARSS